MIKAGTLDAQENPLANTVTYGVHKFHKFHTLSYHFYISRPIFLHRTSFEAWPDEVRRAMQMAVTEAVAYQRKLALEEHESSRTAIEDEGCEINELTPKEHDAFVTAVQPLLADARKTYGQAMFGMWYGKGPGVDRSGDVFRHANFAGTSKNGGVIALMGDDHTAESSTTAHQSEFHFVDVMMPILNPAGVQEIIDYALYGWAMSRFTGAWPAAFDGGRHRRRQQSACQRSLGAGLARR